MLIPSIEAIGLVHDFGGPRVVDDVSLSVRPGEIFGLVGPDGAGKTTTLRLLVGSLTPRAGTVRVAGFDMRRRPDEARAFIGYLSQRFSMYEDLTVRENILFFARMRGVSGANWEERGEDILRFVGLDRFGERRAGALSGGMKQKLGLAAALAHRPRVLLLDEPTTGVDPVTRQDFWQLIIRLVAEENVAALVSTPYMDEASRCGRVGFMRGGRLLRVGAPAELRAPLAGRVVEIIGSPAAALRAAANTNPGVLDAQAFGGRIHARLARPASADSLEALRAALTSSGGRVDSLRVVAPGLEDAFIALAEEVG